MSITELDCGGVRAVSVRGELPGARPVIYLASGSDGAKQLTEIASLAAGLAGTPFVLAAFTADDWNRDFSPWSAPAVFGSDGFSGGGAQTLSRLENVCIPTLERSFPQGFVGARYVAGYSLAGLFSLWAICKSGLFNGAASCSGSLWFPGWLDYLRGASVPDGCSVYLSLGDKEERTRNSVMSRVGDATRESDRIFSENPRVRRNALVWNPGGHFRDVQARIAAGIAYLI